jgi:hypothetical protein
MIEPFKLTFAPAQAAVNVLAKIANDPANPLYAEAWNAFESWRASLATPEQIAMVDTGDELEVDSAGACISAGDDGFFIQTWTWIECSTDDSEDES